MNKDCTPFLSVKQMKNLTTERLNNYRRSFTKKLGWLKHQVEIVGTENSHHDYVRLKNHYSEILEILGKREHLEKK